jgi:transglutaminase-like putative cysteine protease
MQSASPKGLLDIDYVPSRREMLLDRARETMGAGRFWTAILVLLLTITVARSTSTVHWVDGIDVIGVIAVIAAVLMGTLAVLPVAEPVALGGGLLLAPVAAFAGAWPEIHARHPTDVIGPQQVGAWWDRITDGTASSDPSFYLILICLLMWITGGWLAWCVLRWRKPMLGLIPGAAAFATNVLNVPAEQNGYTLAMLVLTLALLLWTNYTGSIASAIRASVKLTGDARWDFWESGLVAMAALIVLGIMLPPLSTADRTLDLESGVFSGWAQLQQRLSHPGIFTSSGGSGVTGFTDDVKLSGSLQRTRDVVFTYSVVGDYASSARYFRGLDETFQIGSEWRFANGNGVRVTLPKNQVPVYSDDYQKLAVAAFNVKMLRPPIGNPDILFYPGQLYKIDRVTLAAQVPLPPSADIAGLYSVDRLASLQPASSSGKYVVTVEYSTATLSQLENAGSNYPEWVSQFSTLPRFGYRSPGLLKKIHELALQIVNTAGAVTPYDQAVAIESYLRDPRNFTYTLDVKTPDGYDPLDYFLFTSHRGYCEFFATAMGDMLRSLGIPTRLVNGFGPGTFDPSPSVNAFVVRGEDAHTWVEVYFPAPAGSTQPYGWIPFEPTADGNYYTIQRGQTGGSLCLRDDGCDTPNSTPTLPGAVTNPKSTRNERPDANAGGSGGGLRVGSIDASTLTRIGAVLVALLLLLLVAASRYLRPRTVMAVWRRMLTLAGLAGVERPPGETPLELGRRLQRNFPEASDSLGALTSGFVVAAYAPPEVAATARPSVMEAWAALRPMLLRRVFARLRPTRP